jgi:hypothetical protein
MIVWDGNAEGEVIALTVTDGKNRIAGTNEPLGSFIVHMHISLMG